MLVFGIYFYYFTNASCFLPLVVPKTVILGRKPFVIIQLSSPSLLNPLGQVQASPVPFWQVRFQSSLQHLKVALHSQPSASKSAEILRDNHAHGTIVKSFYFILKKVNFLVAIRHLYFTVIVTTRQLCCTVYTNRDCPSCWTPFFGEVQVSFLSK